MGSRPKKYKNIKKYQKKYKKLPKEDSIRNLEERVLQTFDQSDIQTKKYKKNTKKKYKKLSQKSIKNYQKNTPLGIWKKESFRHLIRVTSRQKKYKIMPKKV